MKFLRKAFLTEHVRWLLLSLLTNHKTSIVTPQINSDSLTKIVIIENTKFTLRVNVILQTNFSTKVKGQIKRDRQMDKRTGTGREKIRMYFSILTGVKNGLSTS